MYPIKTKYWCEKNSFNYYKKKLQEDILVGWILCPVVEDLCD